MSGGHVESLLSDVMSVHS